MIHELKILPEYFNAVISGEKTFEIRKNDRPFHKGDLLALNEFDPCRYDEIERYKNVTVNVLRCPKCGHTEIEWERQEDTICLT